MSHGVWEYHGAEVNQTVEGQQLLVFDTFRDFSYVSARPCRVTNFRPKTPVEDGND